MKLGAFILGLAILLVVTLITRDSHSEDAFKFNWDMQQSIALYEICINKTLDREFASLDTKHWGSVSEAAETNRFWEVTSTKCDKYVQDVAAKAKELYGSDFRKFLDGVYYSTHGLVMNRIFFAIESTKK